MEKKRISFIDVDDTFIVPSPQRVRNILTLEERIRAIEAYDCRPMYTKVAKMFNCSWEQIKNIIMQRESIMEFYKATKNTQHILDPDKDDIRQRKITFLGQCLYEYIQRAQFHMKVELTIELICMKAVEFRDIIQIDNFTPNKAWINHFKASYNFSLSNRQIMLTRTPPASLDLKDIMTYCTKNKTKLEPTQPLPKNLYRTATKMAAAIENEATLDELKQRRMRKIMFLEKALFEYIRRSRYHHKLPPNEDMLRKVALELKETLKIDNFYPNKGWFNHFNSRYDLTLSKGIVIDKRAPIYSLDLKDILSHCSRMENKNQNANTIKLTPKEPAVAIPVVVLPLKPTTTAKTTKTQSTESAAAAAATGASTTSSRQVAPRKLTDRHKPFKEFKTEIIDLDEDELADIKPNITKELCEDAACQPSPLKIQKIESISDEVAQETVHSPGHWSEHSDDGRETEALPKQVRSYNDALKLLKPLEEFAMLEENYRVIGLITQLEEIFKNPPTKQHETDDD